MKRVSVSVLLAAVTLLGIVVPTAGAAEGEQHCYVRVIDKKASGELVTTEPSCYATTAQMQQAAYSPPTRLRQASTQSTFPLATHYDAANYGGSSTTVYGSDCLGGWLNTSAYWAANMASTRNGCARVKHFYYQNLGTPVWDTTGTGGNLNSTLTNHAWSVQYTT
ncbi:MAG: hypothetical protein JWN67_44 [Actinomycetia bacterium]|nr:hypothetical protein [Actinomycetes bacterium]